jgi:hypothetical protein
MATQPAPAAAPDAPPVPTEVRIYSHSLLFYWWPVWVLGLVLALLTWIKGDLMVVVPKHSTIRGAKYLDEKGNTVEKLAVVLPDEQKAFPEEGDPHLNMTIHKGYGVLYAMVLLIVIFITNVPLRGMWSVVVIMAIIMLSIIFQLAGIWDKIIGAFRLLDIRINLGGYIFFSLGLLGLWLFAFFFFDRQLYIIFSPGQLKVCLEIGAGETAYSTIGMTVKKERSDIFRHWILGLGSGDLIIRTAGADSHEFRLNNVLFIKRKLQLIEYMQSSLKQVVGS